MLKIVNSYPFDSSPIKVGYRYYRAQRSTFGRESLVWGETLHSEGKINIESELVDNLVPEIFMHEVLHCIWSEWCFGKDELNQEDAVSGMANGLTTVLLDNPKLLDYFKSALCPPQ